MVSWNAEGFGTTSATKRGQYHEHSPTPTSGGMKQHPNTAFDTGSWQAGGAAVPLTSDMLSMQHPPNTDTAGISHGLWLLPRKGRESCGINPWWYHIPEQRLGQISRLPLPLHMTRQCFIPGMGDTVWGGQGAASLPQNSHRSKSSCGTLNTDAAPAHVPRCMLGVRVWILTVLLGSCFPL